MQWGCLGTRDGSQPSHPQAVPRQELKPHSGTGMVPGWAQTSPAVPAASRPLVQPRAQTRPMAPHTEDDREPWCNHRHGMLAFHWQPRSSQLGFKEEQPPKRPVRLPASLLPDHKPMASQAGPWNTSRTKKLRQHRGSCNQQTSTGITQG